MREKIVEGLAVGMALYFPLALIFLIFPLNTFSTNLEELRGNIATIVPLFRIAAILGALCLIGGMLLSFARFRWLWGSAAFGLYLGIYVLASDQLIPLATDKHIGFDGSESILPATLSQVLISGALALVCVALFARFRSSSLVKVGAASAGAFLAIGAGGSLFEVSGYAPKGQFQAQTALWNIKQKPAAMPADHPNLYHIVLDGFHGGTLPKAMSLAGLTVKDLDGFIYFPKNRSNYDGTQMSFPSFMSGTIYRSGSMKTWYHAWYRTGMWSKIKKKVPTNLQVYSAHGGYKYTPFNLERKLTIASSGQKSVEDFGDIIFHLSLARATPAPLRHHVFKNGKGVFSTYTKSATNVMDPRLEPFRLMIDDEFPRPDRGQYVYVHIFVPHAPYHLDENCVITKRPNKDFRDHHYVEQSGCAMSYVREFLDTLRRFGRYESSAILIHADHGWPVGEPVEPLKGSEGERRIKELDMTEQVPRTAAQLDTWTSALLLVKPPGEAGRPMVTSARSTQLVDIPNTVYDLLSLDLKAPEGMSVLRQDYPEVAERHVYPGFRRWDRKAEKQVWVGEDVLKGDLNHFSWTSGKGWKVYPNLPFSWE